MSCTVDGCRREARRIGRPDVHDWGSRHQSPHVSRSAEATSGRRCSSDIIHGHYVHVSGFSVSRSRDALSRRYGRWYRRRGRSAWGHGSAGVGMMFHDQARAPLGRQKGP